MPDKICKGELLTSTVGIVCPTYHPNLFLNKLIPSIKYIKELREIAVWLINFNGPNWTKDKIIEAITNIQEYGFNVLHRYTGVWDKPIKVLKMREICASMWQKVDIYLFIDDDFRFVGKTGKYPFSSGQRYLHSIDYMTRNPRCGIVNTKSFLGGTPQKLKIIPVKDGMTATGQGLLLRNMKNFGFLLGIPEIYEMRGGLEEQTLAYLRFEKGFFAAKQMNNPTVHITGKLSDYNSRKDDFHNNDVIDANLAGWIRKRYDDENWDYQKRKTPKKLIQLYLENGGVDLTNPELIIDYSEFEEPYEKII